jgi:hypothetical protein
VLERSNVGSIFYGIYACCQLTVGLGLNDLLLRRVLGSITQLKNSVE